MAYEIRRWFNKGNNEERIQTNNGRKLPIKRFGLFKYLYLRMRDKMHPPFEIFAKDSLEKSKMNPKGAMRYHQFKRL